MKNKINIGNIDFEFSNYVNTDKFEILNKIFTKLNNKQKKIKVSTCSSRLDKQSNIKLNDICDNNNNVNKILNYLTNDDILIILDTEFQSFISKRKKDYIRELAMCIFIKHTTYDKNLKPNKNIKWTHLFDLFVNFELINDKKDTDLNSSNMCIISSDYAAINEENKIKINTLFNSLPVIRNNFSILNEYDNIINNLEDIIKNDNYDFTLFMNSVKNFKKKEYRNFKFLENKKLTSVSELKDQTNIIFKEILNIYSNDELVLNRSFDSSSDYQEKEFLNDLSKLFNSDITVVVKGDNDLLALKNSNYYYNKTYFNIKHIVDIAKQNNYYHAINVGSAKLKDTYNYLRYGINVRNEKIKNAYDEGDNEILTEVTNYLNLTFDNKFSSNNLLFHNPLDDCIGTFFILIMLASYTHIGINTQKNLLKTKNKYFIQKISENLSFLSNIKNYLNLDLDKELNNYINSDSSEILFNFN